MLPKFRYVYSFWYVKVLRIEINNCIHQLRRYRVTLYRVKTRYRVKIWTQNFPATPPTHCAVIGSKKNSSLKYV